jgi:gamma-glutamyltranspeptidase/glutathione hydrolase
MTRPLHTVKGRHGIVTAPHYLAAQAGLGVLEDGGSAAQATITVAATLAVVYPHMTGIGGDGFWLIRESDGRLHGVHGVGAAAAKADLGLYAGAGHDVVPWRGPLAANTVAGTLSAWQAVLETELSPLPLSRLLAPAIALAEEGVVVTAGHAAIAAAKGLELRVQGGAYASVFEPEGRPCAKATCCANPRWPAPCAVWPRPGLSISMTGHWPPMSRPIWPNWAARSAPPTLPPTAPAGHAAERRDPRRAPVQQRAAHAGRRLAADPRAGRALGLCGALGRGFRPCPRAGRGDQAGLPVARRALRRSGLHGAGRARRARRRGPARQHGREDRPRARAALAAALAGGRYLLVWRDRRQGAGRLGDPEHLFRVRLGPRPAAHGDYLAEPGASFRLAQSGWNALKPGRVPFHTLNPALAELADGRVMAYGTMGGEGQPQTQAAVFSRHVWHGMDLQEAISAPRWLLGRTWGEDSTTLKIEDGFDEAVYAALAQAGHEVERVGPLTAMMGHAGALVRHGDGALEGATDPRSDGGVAAW